MMYYGFARMANPTDRVRIALALKDGVGASGTGKGNNDDTMAALKRGR